MTDAGSGAARSPLLVVAAALVDRDGRVLMQRRPPGKAHAGLWEFPGGKVEPGESPEAALVRELVEELDNHCDPLALAPLGFASESSEHRPLVLLLYAVRRWSGTPRPLAADALGWHHPADLGALAMPAADRSLAAVLADGIARLRLAQASPA